MIRYGTKTTVRSIGNGTTMLTESTFHDWEEKKNVIKYVQRVRVKNEQDELAEFLRFTQDTRDKLDRAFLILPTERNNTDGTHFIEKWWTEPL